MIVFRKCVSLLAMLLVLFAFTTGAFGGKPEKVIIVQPNYLVPWLPIYIADRLGYFTDEGLEVSFTTVMGGHNVRAAVISGNAHFGLTGYEQVLSTYEHGKSSKMIMTTTLKHPWSYIGAKNVKSIAEFKGQRIDGGLEASSYRSFARAVVKFGGLDPDKDVFFINIPRGSELAALEKGEVADVLGIDMMKIELLQKLSSR
jgi:NitT/TauT family transport system substrate-binding protein